MSIKEISEEYSNDEEEGVVGFKGELKDKPRICPKCKSAYWDLEKKNGTKKEVKK